MKESANVQHLLQCKNPWGTKSPIKLIIPLEKALKLELYKNEEQFNIEIQQGLFWIEWEIIIKYFNSLYLSWNPAIYPYRKKFHSKWEKGDFKSKLWKENYNLEYNPQFLMKIPPHEDDFEVFLLLNLMIL